MAVPAGRDCVVGWDTAPPDERGAVTVISGSAVCAQRDAGTQTAANVVQTARTSRDMELS
jgi:hypothetical protein